MGEDTMVQSVRVTSWSWLSALWILLANINHQTKGRDLYNYDCGQDCPQSQGRIILTLPRMWLQQVEGENLMEVQGQTDRQHDRLRKREARHTDMVWKPKGK